AESVTGSDSAAAEGSAESRGILRLAHPLLWNGKESLDPASPTQFFSANSMLYDRLTRQDETGASVPYLAASWSTNEEATEWTFILRDGVTFHNGQPLTSADVAYTFAHILDPDTGSSAAATFSLITGTETPDDLTIIFQLAKAHADFPLLLSSLTAGIIPAKSGDTIGESGIGTGPFKLEHLDAEGTTVLMANDDYWQGPPALAGIEISGIAEAQARVLAAQSGQLDAVLAATSAQADLFASDDSFTVLRFPSGRWTGLVMRTDTPPFDDVRVRQAMRLVADRQAIVDLVLDGAGTVTCDTPVGPNDIYRWNGDCPQDIEKAKALLADAGYSDGLDVTLYASNANPQLVPLAEVYQQQAAAAGINVTLEIRPADGFWTEVWMVEPFFTTFWAEFPADEMLNMAWRSNAPWNESYYQNPALDQLLDEARQTLDFDARRQLYQDAQRMIAEDGGHLIPYHIDQFSIVSNKVSNMQARDLPYIDWHLISKSE
ncbi:MAG: ABC transporter substrate-binding protein, partial [Caldilineaceae bacterium]|nr:ABC transporter substrate-binding protein [Caldilineaceae bacterium]